MKNLIALLIGYLLAFLLTGLLYLQSAHIIKSISHMFNITPILALSLTQLFGILCISDIAYYTLGIKREEKKETEDLLEDMAYYYGALIKKYLIVMSTWGIIYISYRLFFNFN